MAEGGQLDSLGDDRRTVARHSLIVERSWSGPLPPASELQAFEFVVPGSAERIIRMSEKALDAGTEVETALARADVQAIKRGQWQLTVIAVTGLAGAITSVVLDAHPTVSVAMTAPALLQFGAALVRNIRTKQD